jgi:hypothetical protein
MSTSIFICVLVAVGIATAYAQQYSSYNAATDLHTFFSSTKITLSQQQVATFRKICENSNVGAKIYACNVLNSCNREQVLKQNAPPFCNPGTLASLACMTNQEDMGTFCQEIWQNCKMSQTCPTLPVDLLPPANVVAEVDRLCQSEQYKAGEYCKKCYPIKDSSPKCSSANILNNICKSVSGLEIKCMPSRYFCFTGKQGERSGVTKFWKVPKAETEFNLTFDLACRFYSSEERSKKDIAATVTANSLNLVKSTGVTIQVSSATSILSNFKYILLAASALLILFFSIIAH